VEPGVSSGELVRSTPIIVLVVLVAAWPAPAQTPPPGPPADRAPTPPPGPPEDQGVEIVIPQYTDESPRPSDAPVVLTADEKAVYDRSKLKYVRATNDVKLGSLTLDRAQFYDIVGRPELAQEARSRTTSRILWITGGSLVAAAGLVAGIILMVNNETGMDCTGVGTVPDAICKPIPSNTATWSGLGLAIGGPVIGAVLIAVGIVTTGPPTTPEQDMQMVERYNRSLLDRLSGRSAAPSLAPAVGFRAGPAGGRVELAWHF